MTTATAPRHAHLDAPEHVKQTMSDLQRTFAQPDIYKLVHPARWGCLYSGHHFETSYTHGEGRLRFYPGGQRDHTEQVIIRGLNPDADFNAVAALLSRP